MVTYRRLIAVLVIVFSALAVAVASAQSIEKPSVAIADFAAGAAGSAIVPAQLGIVAAELMLDDLVEANEFRVFDGQWLRYGTAAAGGREMERALLANARDSGVDFVVFGSISQLSNERQQRTLGGGFPFRGALLGGYRRERNDVTVSLLVRVIDAKTGEVKLSTVGEGRGRRVARSIGGLGLIGKPIAAAFANKATGARDAQLNEALERAVSSAAHIVVSAVSRLVH